MQTHAYVHARAGYYNTNSKKCSIAVSILHFSQGIEKRNLGLPLRLLCTGRARRRKIAVLEDICILDYVLA